MKQLRGVVMCGGKSQRMGTDKGLLPVKDTCWAAFVANKLTTVLLPVVVSINNTQLQQYLPYFEDGQLITDSLNIGGPLNGLLSVHAQYPGDDLLLLACDMIDMQPQTINRLIEVYRQGPANDFYVYQDNDDFAEPFCAIYTSEGLNLLLNRYDDLWLANSSLQKVLKQGNTLHLLITEPASFYNKNTP